MYTIPANLAGLPAMSIPCGTVKEGGMELPVGFQMTAPHFREDLLLKTGFALGK
ncbi:amidase family protein [Akkermansia sp.]|uniref:amidase family protein n=1 Tax=Akkermansia sp. TaxID=1872421 RepID=UPI003AB8E493